MYVLTTFLTAHNLTHSRKSTGVTHNIKDGSVLFNYSVSCDSQNAQCQDPETKVTKTNSAIQASERKSLIAELWIMHT